MTLEKAIEFFAKDAYMLSKYKKEETDFSYIKSSKYIQVSDYWFDNDNNPEENTWIDIEGIGYGWLWCVNWLRKKSKFLQRRAVRKLAYDRLSLILPTDNVFFGKEKKDDSTEIFYGFMLKENCYVEIRLSDHEIHF